MNCDKCDLCKSATHNCILGNGSSKAKIMFIQDCPSDLDDESGVAFSGKSCNSLKSALNNRDITEDDVYFTSLTKCRHPDDEPTNNQVDACSYILETEIKTLDPDIIVPMGNKSLKYTVGKVGLTKMRGNAQEVELLGRKRIILPTVHPRSIRIKPANKDFLLKDLDTLQTLKKDGMTKVSGVDYRSLETVEEVKTEFQRMKKEAKILCFDIETTGKSAYLPESKILCISLTDKTHYGVVVPLYHKDSPFNDEEKVTVSKLVKDLLEDSSIPKVAHNGKFDIEWLYAWMGIDVKNFSFDTMLAHYLAISEEQGTQGLKHQAWEFTDMGGYDNDLDDERQKLPESIRYNYDNIPWDVLKTYAVADVDCCLRLMEVYKPLIDENPKWTTIMNDILMPASYALRDVEMNGMKFDVELSQKYNNTYTAEIERIKARLESYPEVLELEREKQKLWMEREQIKLIPRKDRTKEEQKKFEDYKKYEDYKFNWGSTANLRELLFDRLHLTTSIVTDKGALSTGEDALKEMESQHEIPALLLELRKVTTLNNMFIQKLPTMKDKDDIIHPSFNMCGTVTGRMSSENPNAQQFPRKAENPLVFQYRNEPKALFCSRYGSDGCIMNADYSALEMRIAGVISKDPTLLKALQSGADLHKSTASLVWGVPIDEVPKDMRTNAKAVNFGIIYGKSGISFAQDLYYDKSGKDPKKTDDWEKAKEQGIKLVNDYLKTFNGLDKWLKDTKKNALKCGYVETMFGRRRRLPDLKSKVPTLKSNAERQAINAPIQGTGSDFTLLSIIKIHNYLKDHNMKSMIVATVHDSIVFDVYIPELPIVSKMVKSTMEHIHEGYIDTPIPIKADLELGRNYGSTFEVELEECQGIDNSDKFKKWEHDNKIQKYQKEIKTLHGKGWDYTQVLQYMKENNRPTKELAEFIIDTYSNKENV